MPSHLWKTLCLTALPLVCLLTVLPASAAPQLPPITIVNGSGLVLPNPHLDPVAPSNVSPGQAARFHPHKLLLKFISPDYLIAKMGWPDPGGKLHSPNGSPVPQGVDRVYPIEGDNSLLVFSTVDGFNLVKKIVRSLDVAPRQVSIKVEFVCVNAPHVAALQVHFNPLPTSPPVEVVSGTDAARLYSLISKIATKLIAPPAEETPNDWPVSFPMYQGVPFTTSNTTVAPNGSVATTTNQNYLALYYA